MQMKLTHYIYLSTALTMLTACGEDIDPVYTVGEADNAIVFMAGVSDGGQAKTRAVDTDHTTHKAFTSGTKVALRVDGKWVGRKVNNVSAEDVIQSTTGTIGAASSEHNPISFAATEQLYWDDYGTADPDNMKTGGGRATGLTIYGAAVNGKTSAPDIDGTAGKAWNDLTWILPKDQKNGWADYDLLTSNNISAATGGEGTYKFQDYLDDKKNNTANSNNLMKFTHAMSKISVVLHAGEGFPTHFEEEVSVTFKGFYLDGSVNIISKSSDTADGAIAKDVATWLEDGTIGASGTDKLTYSALVYPGRTFDGTEEILSFTADGNTYKVTSAKLKEKMTSMSQSEMLQGYNYALDITVDKTRVLVDATIVDWSKITAENETPKIDIKETYGHEGTSFAKGFDLYRSTTLSGSYQVDGNHSVISYSSGKYTQAPQLYWPNHNIHYYFRGVWPSVGTGTSINGTYTPSSILTTIGTEQIKQTQIAVQNVAYKEGTFPSDLMIGRPLQTDDVTPDETCKVSGHKYSDNTYPSGICATEGQIRMNFHYMMAKVEVNLVNASELSRQVNLEGAKVELVNVHNSGNILLGSCLPAFTESTGDYELDVVAGDANKNKRLSAIIPQDLTYTTGGATTNLRFKVTIYKSGSTSEIDDIYYADVNPILKSGSTTEKVAPNGKWEAGKYYVYTLTMSKTQVGVTATLKDWDEVEASENIWF